MQDWSRTSYLRRCRPSLYRVSYLLVCLARVTVSGGEPWNRTRCACGREASASAEEASAGVGSSERSVRWPTGGHTPQRSRCSEDAIWLLVLFLRQMPYPLGHNCRSSRRDSNPRVLVRPSRVERLNFDHSVRSCGGGQGARDARAPDFCERLGLVSSQRLGGFKPALPPG